MACDHLLIPKGMRLSYGLVTVAMEQNYRKRREEHDLQSSVYVHVCMFDLSIFLESQRIPGIVFEEKYNINIT